MSDADISLERGDVSFGECLRHEAHAGMVSYSVAIGDTNASTLLTTMLQGKEGEKCSLSYIYAWSIYTKDAATFMHKKLPLPANYKASDCSGQFHKTAHIEILL